MKHGTKQTLRAMCLICMIACILAIPAAYETPINLATEVMTDINKEKVDEINDATTVKHIGLLVRQQKEGLITRSDVFGFVIGIAERENKAVKIH